MTFLQKEELLQIKNQIFLNFLSFSFGFVGVEMKYIKTYAINLQINPIATNAPKFSPMFSLIPSCSSGLQVPVHSKLMVSNSFKAAA